MRSRSLSYAAGGYKRKWRGMPATQMYLCGSSLSDETRPWLFDSTPMTGFHSASTGSYQPPITSTSEIVHHNDAAVTINGTGSISSVFYSMTGSLWDFDEVNDFYISRGMRFELIYRYMRETVQTVSEWCAGWFETGGCGRWSNRYLHSDPDDVTASTEKEETMQLRPT